MHPQLSSGQKRHPSTEESRWKRRRIQVPRKQGELLIEPPRRDIPSLLQQNLQSFKNQEQSLISGVPLGNLRKKCRQQVLQAAVDYTSRWVKLSEEAGDCSRPLLMSGHQPQLVHPGAWGKNLLLGQLAEEQSGIGLNLVVDNDLLEAPGLALPAGDRQSPRFEKFLFDQSREASPWEEAVVLDREFAAGFGRRASDQLSKWGIDSVIPRVWQTVEERLPALETWGELLTAARNRYERSLGIGNLEIPVSRLSDLPCFEEFVAELISRLAEFQQVHNRLLDEFREIYRIRSTTHPVPPLGNVGEWREAPFWVWRSGESRRRPLMVRSTATLLELSDGQESLASVTGSTDLAVDCLKLVREAKESGWKIRPRALTTTLFVRLFLADMFMHGIGGAHYDEITDRLCSQFYGIRSPEFLTVSAGQLLPLGGYEVTPQDEQKLRHRLWDLDQNPERHLKEIEIQAFELIQQLAVKNLDSQLVDRKKIHLELKALRKGLQVTVQTEVRQLQNRLGEVQEQLRANRILNSREYSFALFPEEMLRDLINQLKSGN